MSTEDHSAVPVPDWVIEARGLTKEYRMGPTLLQALRGVDMAIERGEFVALMGTSGSGKSTLLHLLGCLDTPTAGSYIIDGVDASTLSDRERARIRNTKIGFIFQTFNLLSRVSALENVMLPLLYRGKVGDVRTKAESALARVGLAKRTGHAPNEMSGGERQRVAIARALITDPAIILADEPTGNLDSRTSDEIMALLGEVHNEGRTILMVTHDPETATHAQRTLRLRDGQFIDDQFIDGAI
jgi:putative ABC transport system ATP-binding protein